MSPFPSYLELNGPAANCSDRQVPIPATLAFLGLGVGTIGMVRRLRYGRF